jgi:hypothetical protein
MYFVCRWREDVPFSRRVVRLADATVLDWFRRGWHRDDPDDWITAELGGDVYGLSSIFEEARKRKLPRPQSSDHLRELLNTYLWVEGDDDADFIRLGEHALRVRTDDDEVDLAYYFIDDQAAAAAPDRTTFLLRETWPLPADAAENGAVFSHGVPVRTIQLAPPGPDAVYCVRLCWESPDAHRNLDLAGAIVFPGLTLPDLAATLVAVDDTSAQRWPYDAQLLRDLVAPGDDDIGPALERYARLPGYAPSPTRILAERPAQSLIRLDVHIAQVARYIDDFFGFDQWFLFDSTWAAAHPDLARSLLRYAAHWDPYET